MADAQDTQRWQSVTHAHVRSRDGGLVAGAPEASSHVCLPASWGVVLWESIQLPRTIEEVAAITGRPPAEVSALMGDLQAAGLVATSEASITNPLSFHDALMHARSRGITDEGFGKTTRTPLPPEDVAGVGFSLPTVEGDARLTAITCADVLTRRRTTREWSTDDVTLAQVSALLWHGARDVDGSGQHFPYPYAGPAMATRIAVAAGRVEGLDPGLYVYEAAHHALVPWPPSNPAPAERLPVGEYISGVAAGHRPGDRHPPLMLIVLSDLAALTSSYDGLAYANALKTAGAIQVTVSLAATALGLGSTILGLASDMDTRDVFDARVSRLTPIAEMAVGIPRTGSP